MAPWKKLLSLETGNNIQDDHCYIDDSFKKDYTEQYTLCLLLKLDYAALSVLDNKTDKYLVFKVYPFEKIYNFYFLKNVLHTTFLKEELLNYPYQTIKVGISNNVSTLVPNAFYNERNPAGYLTFNHTVSSNEHILIDQLPSINSRNIWSVNRDIINLLNDQFSTPKINHTSTSLIETLINENKAQHDAKLFVNVNNNILEIIYIDKGRLVFYNSFGYRTPEDFIYHILFICEQLNIDTYTIDLILIGQVEKNAAVYEITYKYIKNIHFGKRPIAYLYSTMFKEIASHFYFNTFSLNVCE